MKDCVFCQIVAGNKQAHVVYEDDLFIAFLDHSPRSRGHSLVIPRKHHRWVDDVPEFGKYFEVARKVSQALKRALGSSWTQYLTIGELVPHAHIQVIPRFKADIHGAVADMSFFEKISEKDMAEIAKKIRREIE
jgi:histidine triad (HIT) family protein